MGRSRRFFMSLKRHHSSVHQFRWRPKTLSKSSAIIISICSSRFSTLFRLPCLPNRSIAILTCTKPSKTRWCTKSRSVCRSWWEQTCLITRLWNSLLSIAEFLFVCHWSFWSRLRTYIHISFTLFDWAFMFNYDFS